MRTIMYVPYACSESGVARHQLVLTKKARRCIGFLAFYVCHGAPLDSGYQIVCDIEKVVFSLKIPEDGGRYD